jgi:hypothetical protein
MIDPENGKSQQTTFCCLTKKERKRQHVWQNYISSKQPEQKIIFLIKRVQIVKINQQLRSARFVQNILPFIIMSSTKETQCMMEKRHQEENAELEETAKTLLKAAKKGKKAEIESKIIQMQFDLKAKHYAEEEELENEADNIETLISVDEKPISLEVVSIRDSNDEVAGESKKAKAKRKQEKKTQKEAERLSVKEKIKESNSGPSAREIELERINSTLKIVGCEIKPIVSDGNCLYRFENIYDHKYS